MKIFKKLLYFLLPKEKKSATLLLLMILTMALIDMLGVASILPFMAVLTNTSLIETNFILSAMFQSSSILGVKTNQEFIFLLGILVFIILIFSLSFKAVTIYVQVRFIAMRELSIGKRLMESYLHQPYNWFLNRNSAELGKSILSETAAVSGGMLAMVDAITHSAIAVSLLFLLFFVDIKLTLVATFIIGGAYFLIFSIFRKYLGNIGKELLIVNGLRFKSISEAFGATKELKVGGLEKIFVKKFYNPALIYAKNQASSSIISQLPKYFIEGTAFGGMILLILYIISQTGTFNNAIPIISVYAFAGYRLIPSIQNIYRSIASLSYHNETINKLFNDLKNANVPTSNQNQGILSFNKTITLNHIHYNYPNSSKTALTDISLTIPYRTTVGIVGTTGCGKTTTVDIILGLLEPQKGSLEIDGMIITEKNIRAWQRSIGYVPQHIFLSDDTIAANIAFGVDLKDINFQSVEKAAKIANLDMFVINELPDQYETIIGERGVRLSGGQRQRIGIARALYHNPKLLILDEATSALDNQTEKVIMEAVNKLSKDITIILITHRLTTVKKCDKIFLLENGKLKAEGDYDKLIEFNNYFRSLAGN
tara:strand:- start:7356 stop:9143 length:1788 start_codon:yes stop_codon:yes gene_type:complete